VLVSKLIIIARAFHRARKRVRPRGLVGLPLASLQHSFCIARLAFSTTSLSTSVFFIKGSVRSVQGLSHQPMTCL
jgi:hypothetical protein